MAKWKRLQLKMENYFFIRAFSHPKKVTIFSRIYKRLLIGNRRKSGYMGD